MKFRTKTGLFPWFTILLGIIGFCLRCRLYAGSSGGLLPQRSAAGILCFVLFAVTAVLCALGIANVGKRAAYASLFPGSQIAGIGTAIAAVGFLVSAFTLKGAGTLGTICTVLVIPAAFSLAATGYCRYANYRPKCILHCVVAVYLMLRTMALCQVWRAESQLEVYFFPLLAGIFLLIACYYRAELDLLSGNCRKYVFFAQLSLFCCCLSCRGDNWLFYLAGAIWMAADFCTLPSPGKFGQ